MLTQRSGPKDRNRQPLKTLDQRVDELAEWFLHSPIHLGAGAYAQFYRPGRTGPVYPEITAYAVTLGCLLFDHTGREEFLDRAREAAEYLIGIGSPPVPGIDGNEQFTFDTAIFLDALFVLAERDHDHQDRWLSTAAEGLKWLYSLGTEDGFPSVPPAASGAPDPYAWHLRQSMHLTKLAIPFTRGARAFDRPDYEAAARRILDWTVALQRDGGGLPINTSTECVRLHPHCYALEGLLFCGAALDDGDYTEAARRGAGFLVDRQNADGSFPQWFPHTHGSVARRLVDRATGLRVGDAPSQAIRIWRVLDMAEGSIQRAERFIESVRAGDGVPLHIRSLGPVERAGPVYSWPTFFYLHACMVGTQQRPSALELF